MKENVNNYYTVQLLQDEIKNLKEEYKTSDYIEGIKDYLPTNQFVKDDLLEGLWYYFAIHKLASRNGYTIIAYEENYISLEKIIEDKIWLYHNWSKDSLFHEFNDFINNCVKLKKMRETWKIESELQSFATSGFSYILKLHNDEKFIIQKRLLNYEELDENDKQDYIQKIEALEKANQKLQISKYKYMDLYEQIALLRKENNKVTDNIRTVVSNLKGKHSDLDKLFLDKNNNIDEVIEHIRQLFYQSKYCKL